MAEVVFDEVSKLIQWFEDSEEATVDDRKLSERDRDFFLGKQLTKKQEIELEKRGQPIVISNRVRPKMNFVAGAEIELRTDPKAFPRNPNDEDAAEAATDSIRFAIDNNVYDVERSAARENLAIEGIAIIEVGAKVVRDRIEVTVKQVAWDRFFYDPRSSKKDFSDARYMGIIVWMDLDNAKRKYPGKDDLFDSTIGSVTVDDTFDDKPHHGKWADANRKRVRVVQIYWKKADVWHMAVITKGGALEAPAPVFYIDEDGEPENPLIAQSMYVDRDNQRHGLVRDMISPQQEINKRKSKALHLFSTRQFMITKNSGTDANTVRAEFAKPDGVVEVNRMDDLKLLETGDMAIGQFQLLQHALAELEAAGPNASLQGKDEKNLSGRAIQAQQQGGMVELKPYLDAGRQLDLKVYRAVWNRIRQFWTEKRWIRITDDERNIKFVGLNQPVTHGELFEQEVQERGINGQEAQELMAVAQEHPQFNEVARIDNEVGKIDVDIVVDEGPDIVTIQGEQFEQIVQLASIPGALKQTEGAIEFKDILKLSSLRNKDQIIERMEGGGEDPEAVQAAREQAEQQAQVAQQAQALQFAGAEADIAETESKTVLHEAQAFKAIEDATAP